MALNQHSLDEICSALCFAFGIEPPKHAAPAHPEFLEYLSQAFGGRKPDRIVMYNPDAVAQWIYEKYLWFMREVDATCECKLPLQGVMPSVTPVSFGTLYTGAQPSVHGIQKYEKPVIRIDTIFDALIRQGKKPVIVCDPKCSIGQIFLEREMDYFHLPSIDQINLKAKELLMADEYDFYVIYNGNYDSIMHKFGPESPEALAELRSNARAFNEITHLIQNHWQHHDTLLGFAMDHGCHEIDGSCGSHGLDMPEDLNITHLYQAFPKA